MAVNDEKTRRSGRLQQKNVNNTEDTTSSNTTDSKRSSTSPDSKPKKRIRPSKIPLTEQVEDNSSNSTLSTDESINTPETKYWLMKAEPNSRLVKGVDVKFSIDDLQACPNQTSSWEGVRNYEARNLLRDQIKPGDHVLFYHSNCKPPGISGLATIVKGGYVDHTAFDPKHPYYDPKSDIQKPKWYMVDVKFVRKLKRFISLKELQGYKSTKLSKMPLINRGRLSVQPVGKEEFDFVLSLEHKED
ncbi:hypothetical protein K7432_006507 [Basidiobolus ranarum]|uniref:EVE domain-containing protein n=1 Tax=Basidiobolus ranarum TaxID=34480 RepID=A0ABR2W1Q2_9FUNG